MTSMFSVKASTTRTRRADDQWNLDALIEMTPLAEHPVVPELFSMVAGEYDHGVVIFATRLERGYNAADVVIDLGHQPVVSRAQLAHRGFDVGVRCRVEALEPEMVTLHVGSIGM